MTRPQPRSPVNGRPNRRSHRTLKRKGPALGRPSPHTVLYSTLPLGNDRRRGFALADVLRAPSDAQESQYRCCC